MSDRAYVIVAPDGVYWVGLAEDEKKAWRIALGWPTIGEVREKTNAGWYCAQCELSWHKPK